MSDVTFIHHLPVALGIGLLIGAERERRKVERPAAAGLRTFTIAALLGCGAALMPQPWMLAIAMLCMTALVLMSSWRRRNLADPGITTEVTLVATTLLGAMAVTAPLLAGALAVLIAIVLAARDPLHRFVGQTISADEIADILLIAGTTLIVLPMLPDRQMGPFDALNPHSIWMVVVMILGINALGQVATRLLGARLGVPALGLISGLVSSSATIGAMGAWVRANPASAAAGAAAAVLSTVANYAQMAVVIEATDHRTFLATIWPVGLAGLAALVSGGWLTFAAWREVAAEPPKISRSFNLLMALTFAATVAIMMVAAAALRAWFGDAGLIAMAAIGGVLDVHAAVISVAAQVADGTMAAPQAVVPTLMACTTSTIAKIVFATAVGTRAFAARVIPAQLLIIGAAWLTTVIG